MRTLLVVVLAALIVLASLVPEADARRRRRNRRVRRPEVAAAPAAPAAPEAPAPAAGTITSINMLPAQTVTVYRDLPPKTTAPPPTTTAAPEKPCAIRCRASSLEACGITDEHVQCRRRYVVGCIDELCHGKRRVVHTKSPAERRLEERNARMRNEMPCDVLCKMQAFKKCGVTSGFDACRVVYSRDCGETQCKEPACEADCRVMAFHACGVGTKFDRCREDYRELCRPIRCMRATCERESLLECGEKTCRDAYIARCMERKGASSKLHSEFNQNMTQSDTIDAGFKASDD